MTEAANYSAGKATVDSVEVVRLTDTTARIEVSIAPSIGNIAYDMQVNGKPILLPPQASLADWKAKPTQAGIPFLAPWANRLDGDAYWANGTKYLLNPDAVSLRRDSNGLAIHGLLLFASDWHVVALNADQDAAEVTSRLEFWRHPEWMAMPLSIGFHAWYQIPNSPRDNWKVHLPVREHYSLSGKLIPTGETTHAQFDDPTPLAGRQLDDVFGGVAPTDEFWVEGNGRRISIRFGPKYPIAVIFAPQSRNVICFEPMTAITNAFNLSHAGVYKELQTIPPGGKWQESFWVRPSGF